LAVLGWCGARFVKRGNSFALGSTKIILGRAMDDGSRHTEASPPLPFQVLGEDREIFVVAILPFSLPGSVSSDSVVVVGPYRCYIIGN
jgi:hypothetical protein